MYDRLISSTETKYLQLKTTSYKHLTRKLTYDINFNLHDRVVWNNLITFRFQNNYFRNRIHKGKTKYTKGAFKLISRKQTNNVMAKKE